MAGFDPAAYLAEKTAASASAPAAAKITGFDPAAYLAEKTKPSGEVDGLGQIGMILRSGLAGQTAGISEPVVSAGKAAFHSFKDGKKFKDAYAEDVAQRKAEIEANPGTNLSAEVAGALIPSPINVYSRALKGGSMLARMIGLGAKELPAGVTAAEAYNLLSKSGKAADLAKTVARGAVTGGAAGAIADTARQAVQVPTVFEGNYDPEALLRSAVTGAKYGAALEPIGAAVTRQLSKAPKMKPNAPEIQAAGETLGTKPTIGMLTDSKFLQGTESSLEQSPHMGAGKTKAAIEHVRATLKDTAETMLQDAAQNTNTEIGGSVRKGLADRIAKEIAPAEDIYNKLEGRLAETPAIIRNANDAIVQLQGIGKVNSEMRGIVNTMAADLTNVQTVADLKNMRSAVNAQLRNPNISDMQRMALNRVKSAITTDRRDSILQGAKIMGMDPEHVAMSLDAADHIYAGAAKMAQESLPISEKVGPKGVGRALDKFNDTQLGEKAFNVNDVPRLEALKQNFPEQFEQLRQQRIRSILDNVTRRGQVSAPALIKEINKLEPESLNLIFGKDAAKKVHAMETLINAFPEKMGPSGTPQGLAFDEFIVGILKGRPATNIVRQGIYRTLGNRAIEGAPPLLQNGSTLDAIQRKLNSNVILDKAKSGINKVRGKF